jgi:hypothetical protein
MKTSSQPGVVQWRSQVPRLCGSIAWWGQLSAAPGEHARQRAVLVASGSVSLLVACIRPGAHNAAHARTGLLDALEAELEQAHNDDTKEAQS